MDAILKLPPSLRHLLVMFAAVGLSWLGTEILPFLQNESNVYGALLAALLAAFIAWATPLVSSYGVGAERARELGARTPEQAAGRVN